MNEKEDKKPKCEIKCNRKKMKMCSKTAKTCVQNYDSRDYKPEYTPAGGFKYQDPRQFRISDWDPNDLPEDKCISVIWVGKRRTGKSFGERWYLWARGADVKEVYVFTKTRDNGWYQKFLPPAFIFKGWQPETAKAVMERGRTQIKRGNKPQDVGIVVIGDDLISDHGMRYDEILDELYTAGRHSGVEAHWMTQKYKAVPPQTRINADVLIIFTVLNGQEKKAFIEEYLSCMNKQTASEFLDMYTDPVEHTALVIETWRNSHDPEEYIKVLKAWDPKVKPGDIGSREYWEEGEKDLGKKDIENSGNYLMDFNYKKMSKDMFTRLTL